MKKNETNRKGGNSRKTAKRTTRRMGLEEEPLRLFIRPSGDVEKEERNRLIFPAGTTTILFVPEESRHFLKGRAFA